MNRKKYPLFILCFSLLFSSLFSPGGVTNINSYFDRIPSEAKDWIKNNVETITQKLEASSAFGIITLKFSYKPESRIYSLEISDRGKKEYSSKEALLSDLNTSSPVPGTNS